jgi:Zn-dependent protease
MAGGRRMSADNIVFRIATWLIPLVIAIVLHEIAHGWVALPSAIRPPSAKRRLSLNPLRHVDPIGTVALPLVLAVSGAPLFGWAKPVPVVARRLRNPRVHMMLVALAGPGMNLLLAILGAVAWAGLRWLQPPEGLGWDFLILNVANFMIINVSLAIFNLLPIPPFDGGHVVEGLLPRPLACATRGSAATASRSSCCCSWCCRWRTSTSSPESSSRRSGCCCACSGPAAERQSGAFGNANRRLIAEAAAKLLGQEEARNMIRKLLIAAMLCWARCRPMPSAHAAPGEVRIPRMGGFLDWRPDGSHGLYIRADTGRWYHASLQNDCPRLVTRSNVRFIAAPNGDFDRYSARSSPMAGAARSRASAESDGPPDYNGRHHR